MSVSVYISEETDPYLNLSFENSLLSQLSDHPVLFLYINAPSIVMGRFQNPWIECNLKKVREDNINLVRRQSGGGTVYHDLGNINFCFLHPTRDYKKNDNLEFIIEALRDLGVDAFKSERSDLLINKGIPFKVSGAAFKQKKDRSFHHGTLLIDAEVEKLNYYLNSKDEGLKTKSIASNKSVVANLNTVNQELTPKLVVQKLAHNFGGEIKVLSNICESEYSKELRSWDCIYGETPLFEYVREFGSASCSLEIKKGSIIAGEVSVDEVYPGILDEFSKGLIGLKLYDLSSYCEGFLTEYETTAELSIIKNLLEDICIN